MGDLKLLIGFKLQALGRIRTLNLSREQGSRVFHEIRVRVWGFTEIRVERSSQLSSLCEADDRGGRTKESAASSRDGEAEEL